MPPSLPRVLVDAERIEQVLVNLVANALKFTSEGSVTVSIRPSPEDHGITVAVSDTGVGISPRDQQQIFDEFTQIRGQMEKRQREGSGLGLAISRRIVEAHDGHLRVQSESGRGSTFSFLIPLKRRASSEAVSGYS
jgi:signal transduction histidine kinase